MVNRILLVSSLAVLFWTGAAVTQEKQLFTADYHKELGLTCAVCHQEDEPKPGASGDSCLTCHESIEAVAKKTKDYQPNPHQNHLTDSSDVACTQCHHGHKADTPVCEQCHSGMTFGKMQVEPEPEPEPEQK